MLYDYRDENSHGNGCGEGEMRSQRRDDSIITVIINDRNGNKKIGVSIL